MKGKKKSQRLLWLLLLLSLFGTSAFVAWLHSDKTRWFSSPIADRTQLEPAIWLDIPGAEFLSENKTFSETSKLPEPVDGVFDLGNGAKIFPEAFAVCVPGLPQPSWRDPFTLRPLNDQQLLAPSELLKPDSHYESPMFHILFRADGPKNFVPHVRDMICCDGRTGHPIGVRNINGSAIHQERTIGRWTRLSFRIQIWHDTPVELGLEWFCGLSEVVSLRKTGDSVWQNYEGGERACLAPEGSDGFVHGERRAVYGVPSFSGFDGQGNLIIQSFKWKANFEPRDGWGINSALLVHSKRHGPEAVWFGGRSPELRSGIGQSGLPCLEKVINLAGEPTFVQLLKLGGTKATRLSIDGMPDMPNGRDLENLFEARIPRAVTLEPFHLAADAAEMQIAYSPDLPWSIPNAGHEQLIQPVMIFEDVSVQEILETLEAEAENPPFRVESDELRIIVGEEEDPTRLERIRNWWNEHVPAWLQLPN